MTRRRFVQLKSILRFDDPLRRDSNDPLSPIRHLFEEFNLKLRQVYEPSEYLTIDEQLLEFHGRVKFKQYIASKPGRFGIKIFWLCCAETFYFLNGIIYIGRGSYETGQNVTTAGVSLHLMKPYLNTGRNLTGDNWFTSAELCDTLRSSRISYVGTLRNNNRCIPQAAKATENRTKKDTRVYYDDNGTVLVSFWDKGTKPVLLLDTFNPTVPVPDVGEKPSTVKFYNETKSGVDVADKRVRGLSCKRKCRRWPFAIFSNMVDVAGNNGSILYYSRRLNVVQKSEQHYTFLKNCGYQLIDAHIRRRIINDTSLAKSTKAAIHDLGYEIQSQSLQPIRLQKSKRCSFCPYSRDRKTFICCTKCSKTICNEHRSYFCIDCEKSS